MSEHNDQPSTTAELAMLKAEVALLRMDLTLHQVEHKVQDAVIRETRWDPNNLHCRIEREARHGVLSGLRRERIRRRIRRRERRAWRERHRLELGGRGQKLDNGTPPPPAPLPPPPEGARA